MRPFERMGQNSQPSLGAYLTDDAPTVITASTACLKKSRGYPRAVSRSPDRQNV
jgi:hypothetical protein